VGVVLMAYGTPRGVHEIETYYTDIRRGRPPTPEQLAELTARYAAIGGTSPLAQRTEAQRVAIQHALDARAPGRFDVVLGLKHAQPKIEDAVSELAAAGVREAVGLVLAPHWSALSIGEYQRRAAQAGRALGVHLTAVSSWHLDPAYLEFLAGGVRDGLARLPAGAVVLFTAHSLPRRILDTGDPYPDQLRATGEAVAGLVGLAPAQWSIAWQSAGRTPEPWLGPDVLTVLRDLAAAGATGALVCSAGFVADHLEVLYDLDIEAAGVAASVGLPFARTPVVNDDPGVMTALADLVVAAAGQPA
jgi:ferrochelatase